jgi:PAS domain S-box-containing protein
MKFLKALIAEDSNDDAALLLLHLSKESYEVQSEIVQNAADLHAALGESKWDIILSGYRMPGFGGLDALAILKESNLDIPIIIISGTGGEDIAVEAMLRGAGDYLMKDNLTRLAPAIERELENAAKRRKQKQAEEDLRLREASLADAQRIAQIGSWDIDLSNNHLDWSDETYRIFGRTKTRFEATYQAFINAIHPEDRQRVRSAAEAAISQIAPYEVEYRIMLPDGAERVVCEIGEVSVDGSGKPRRVTGTVQDITERYAAETKMRQLKSAVDSIAEGILITDAQKPGNPIIYTNSAFEKLTGYSFEEIKGQSCRFLQGAETNRRTVDEIREAIKQEKSFRGEILNYRKNGEPFWNELSISPIFDDSGRLTNYVGAQQDINERKKAEKTLRASEAKIRQLVDSSIIGIIITSLDGSIVEANDVFLNSVGYSRSELLEGKLRWNEMTPPELLWQDERAKKQLNEFGYSIPREKEYIRKDGSRVPVMVGGTLLKGTENTVLAFVLDISERKLAEEALRESELRLRTILETEPECVKIIGLEGELLEMNRAGLAMIEADSIEQVRGAQVLKIVAPEHRIAFANLTKKVLAGNTETLEFKAVGLKGTRRWLETHAVPMRNQTGKITSVLGVTRDITERKRAEYEKALLAAQIEDQHERLNNIVANVPGIVWEAWDEPDITTQRIDFVSEYVEKMLGYTVEEWLATPNFWLSIVHPEDRKRIAREEASGKLLGGEGYIKQFRWITKDGRIVWVESQTTVIHDKSGQPIGLRGINIDITERKQLEEERTKLIAELDLGKARLEHIFDNSPSFIVSMRGPRFVYEMANPAFYQLVGQRDLIGIPVSEAVPEIMTQGFPDLLSQVYHTGEPYFGNELAVKLQTPNSSEPEQHYVNFVLLPLREADNSISGVISYGMDVTEQVLAKIKIQESEERYRIVAETANDVIITIDEHSSILFVNAAVENVLGYKPAELIGNDLSIIVPEHSRAAHRAGINRYIQTGKKTVSWKGLELSALHRDGQEIRAEISIGEYHENNKRFFAAVIRDINERKRAEEIILESEEKYRSIVETANEGIWLTDIETRATYVNRQMAEMLGYSIDEMLGRPIFDFIFDEDLPAAKHKFEQRLAGKSETGEFRMRRKDGSEIITLYNSTPRRNHAGEIVGFLTMRSDITESKKAEREIQNAETKYRSLVESSPAVVYLTESQPPFSPIYVSPNISRFGYTTEEWFARPDLRANIIHEDDRREILRATEEAIARNIETDLEYRIVRRDDTIIWIHEKGRFVLDGQGNKTGWQGVMVDITKTKELEEQLRQSQKLESVGRLAGGIAHDFNNMLTAINGYSELTLRKLDAESPLRRNIEEIKKAGERSALLTHQLLAFSRKQVMQSSILDLNEVIVDTGEMLERVIGEAIRLETRLGAKGHIKGDAEQLSQIIMNLAVNARDAMPQGGKLTIETADVFLNEEFAAKHYPTEVGSYVMLSVTDNGSGMDSETQKIIFEPFYTTKAAGKGTGLSLATVYGIVKQSGGFIWVESEIGVGSTFNVYLPCIDGEIESQNVETDVEGSTEAAVILVVDDEDLVRAMTRQALEECGYQIIEASSGRAALEICRQMTSQIELVITDVMMPEMDGRELAGKLAEFCPQMRVLFTSGYSNYPDVRLNSIGINNFIQKPFTFDALVLKVEESLAREN